MANFKHKFCAFTMNMKYSPQLAECLPTYSKRVVNLRAIALRSTPLLKCAALALQEASWRLSKALIPNEFSIQTISNPLFAKYVLLSISSSYRKRSHCTEARRIQCRLAPMTNERFHNAYFSLLHTLYQHAGVHDNPTFFISW